MPAFHPENPINTTVTPVISMEPRLRTVRIADHAPSRVITIRSDRYLSHAARSLIQKLQKQVSRH
ncbi:hypothetical protein O9H85_30815 [Paenibacillus filicis]|uniref:Uncharacterized protein n=1 Tax=Paenibacillus gyeongsangnamensis TaxID=3388067 RepID=A0ABT4QII7_9BACL|nr:hypothetical protein [Paenibacillus filicis]MCZ8516694.1 hypothetical protein [Paenibacillus filicis]